MIALLSRMMVKYSRRLTVSTVTKDITLNKLRTPMVKRQSMSA